MIKKPLWISRVAIVWPTLIHGCTDGRGSLSPCSSAQTQGDRVRVLRPEGHLVYNVYFWKQGKLSPAGARVLKVVLLHVVGKGPEIQRSYKEWTFYPY